MHVNYVNHLRLNRSGYKRTPLNQLKHKTSIYRVN